ncbi:MAG: hypothetical protein ACO3E0_05420 [Candidatus Kapaibacteriota bacterium]
MICKATMRVITVLTLSVVTATTMHAQIDTIRVATADDLRDALVTRRTLPTVFLLEAGEYIVTEPIALTNRQELIGQGADRTVMRFRLQQPTSCIRIHGARSASIPVDTLLWDGSRYRVTPALHTVPPSSWVELTDDDRALVTSDWAIGSAGLIGTVDAQGWMDDQHGMCRSDLDPTTARMRYLTPVEDAAVRYLKLVNETPTETQTSTIDVAVAVRCTVECVESEFTNFAHVELNRSVLCVIRGNYFHDAHAFGGGGQGYGTVLQYTSNRNLVENNTYRRLRHSILLQAGAYHNTIVANYSREPYWTDVTLPADAAGDIVLHGNWVHHNHVMNNIVQQIVIDDSHGANGPGNFFARNRAENYGLFMNFAPATDSIIFLLNEITSRSASKGLYLTFGNGHLLARNRVKGALRSTETSLEDAEAIVAERTAVMFSDGSAYVQGSAGIGEPSEELQATIEAYNRLSVACTSQPTSVRSSTENYWPMGRCSAYTVRGTLVCSAPSEDELLQHLQPGAYVVVCGSTIRCLWLQP